MQRKLLTLRIADLHSILQGFAYSKNARKETLQRAVLELLASRQPTLLQKREIKNQVEQCYTKISSIATPRSKTPEMQYAQQYSANPLVSYQMKSVRLYYKAQLIFRHTVYSMGSHQDSLFNLT